MDQKQASALMLAAAGVGALLATRTAIQKSRNYDLRDKVTLITGGSRGLGLVMAREFGRRGAKLALCARNEEELDRARADLEERGISAFVAPCDIADRQQVQSLVESVADRLGPVNVLVNNAGVIDVGPMETMTLEDYERAMNTHFWGALYLILAVLPEMRERQEGRIVNITSIGGKISVPHLLPYCASKFAVVGLSQGLRAELAKDGIAVTTVVPGMMRTGSPAQAYFKGKHREEYTWFSIGDSIPGFSISAEGAARKIADACQRGENELVFTLPAEAGVLFQGIFPGLTSDLMALVNRLLPEAGGIGEQRAKGYESHSKYSPSWLTTLTEQAAQANNEISEAG